MRLYKILHWLTLLGDLFMIALGFLMDYFDTNTASFVTSRTSYGNSIKTNRLYNYSNVDWSYLK